LKLRFFRAEKLPKMDTFGTIDAYIKCEYFNKKVKTKVIKAKDDLVEWNQEIWVWYFVNSSFLLNFQLYQIELF
jgi:hypothetical protein